MPRARLLCGGLLCLMLGSAGCHVGPRNFENDNDALRAQNLELQRTVKQLEEELDRRVTQVKVLQQSATGDLRAFPDVDPPMLTAIQLGRYSGPVDTNDDGRDDVIRLYVKPVDQDGRMLSAVGRAVVQAVAFDEHTEPTLVAQATYEPEAFRKRYREGFTGTHYTLEIALPDDVPGVVKDVTVKVTFQDAASGTRLEVQEAYRLDLLAKEGQAASASEGAQPAGGE